jgi:hypothetical protein
MLSKEKNKPELLPGSCWVAINGSSRVTAHVRGLEAEQHHSRVYFTVDHRPGETLNCYAEAFRSRYTPVVE